MNYIFLKYLNLNSFRYQFRKYHHRIGLIGALFSKGQTKNGTELGPKYFRQAGIIKKLKDLHYDVKDFGDVEMFIEQADLENSNFKVRFPRTVASATHQLVDKTIECLKEDRICLTLGGDHSLGVGSVFAHCTVKPNLCLLWIDAHADINTAEGTTSGNIHGMAVSFLVRQVCEKYNNPNSLLDWFDPIKACICSNQIAYIGLRDVDPYEIQLLKELNITYFSMRDIDKWGIFEIVNQALDKINPGLERPIHVSFDIDSLDEHLAPSTGTSVPGGLTLREALCIGEQIYQTKKLSVLDFVEVNPLIGTNVDVKRTIHTSLCTILSFFGKKRIGHKRVGYELLKNV